MLHLCLTTRAKLWYWACVHLQLGHCSCEGVGHSPAPSGTRSSKAEACSRHCQRAGVYTSWHEQGATRWPESAPAA